MTRDELARHFTAALTRYKREWDDRVLPPPRLLDELLTAAETYAADLAELTTGPIHGDGSGPRLPPLPDNAYPPDAKPLEPAEPAPSPAPRKRPAPAAGGGKGRPAQGRRKPPGAAT